MRRFGSIAASWVLLVGSSSCAVHSRPVSSIGQSSATDRGESPASAADEHAGGEHPTAHGSNSAAKQPPATDPVPATDPPAGPQPPPTPTADSPAPSDGPEPKLLSDAGSIDEVRAKLDRGLALADGLGERSLSVEQADLLLSGRQFLTESAEAVKVGDLQRASLLADKALVLLEELEQSTRP